MTNLAADLALVAESYTKDVALPDGVTWPDDVIREAIRQVEYAEGLRKALADLFWASQNEMVARGLPLEWKKDSPMGRAAAALLPPSQGGECAGLAPPAGCRWPKTCGAQLAEAAVREEGENSIHPDSAKLARIVQYDNEQFDRHHARYDALAEAARNVVGCYANGFTSELKGEIDALRAALNQSPLEGNQR